MALTSISEEPAVTSACDNIVLSYANPLGTSTPD
jgi:hypothetical protein